MLLSIDLWLLFSIAFPIIIALATIATATVAIAINLSIAISWKSNNYRKSDKEKEAMNQCTKLIQQIK